MVIRWGNLALAWTLSFFHKTPPLAPAAGGPPTFYSGVCFLGLSPENDWRWFSATQIHWLPNFCKILDMLVWKTVFQEASLPSTPLYNADPVFLLYFTAEWYASLCRIWIIVQLISCVQFFAIHGLQPAQNPLLSPGVGGMVSQTSEMR